MAWTRQARDGWSSAGRDLVRDRADQVVGSALRLAKRSVRIVVEAVRAHESLSFSQPLQTRNTPVARKLLKTHRRGSTDPRSRTTIACMRGNDRRPRAMFSYVFAEERVPRITPSAIFARLSMRSCGRRRA